MEETWTTGGAVVFWLIMAVWLAVVIAAAVVLFRNWRDEDDG